jgi:hypothetical protein
VQRIPIQVIEHGKTKMDREAILANRARAGAFRRIGSTGITGELA